MRKLVTSGTIALLFPVALGLLFGARGAAAGAVIAFVWLVWRHDNQTGTCLPIAILFLLVLGVMFFLFFLLVIVHPR